MAVNARNRPSASWRLLSVGSRRLTIATIVTCSRGCRRDIEPAEASSLCYTIEASFSHNSIEEKLLTKNVRGNKSHATFFLATNFACDFRQSHELRFYAPLLNLQLQTLFSNQAEIVLPNRKRVNTKLNFSCNNLQKFASCLSCLLILEASGRRLISAKSFALHSKRHRRPPRLAISIFARRCVKSFCIEASFQQSS